MREWQGTSFQQEGGYFLSGRREVSEGSVATKMRGRGVISQCPA